MRKVCILQNTMIHNNSSVKNLSVLLHPLEVHGSMSFKFAILPSLQLPIHNLALLQKVGVPGDPRPLPRSLLVTRVHTPSQRHIDAHRHILDC